MPHPFPSFTNNNISKSHCNCPFHRNLHHTAIFFICTDSSLTAAGKLAMRHLRLRVMTSLPRTDDQSGQDQTTQTTNQQVVHNPIRTNLSSCPTGVRTWKSFAFKHNSIPNKNNCQRESHSCSAMLAHLRQLGRKNVPQICKWSANDMQINSPALGRNILGAHKLPSTRTSINKHLTTGTSFPLFSPIRQSWRMSTERNGMFSCDDRSAPPLWFN